MYKIVRFVTDLIFAEILPMKN